MLRISDKSALENYAFDLERSRWTSKELREARDERYAYRRLRHDVLAPILNAKMVFGRDAQFFAMGSCFAREVEQALDGLGMNVLSLMQRGVPIRFAKGGYTNRYNTCSMLNEIKFALGIEEFNTKSAVAVDTERTRFLDLHSHPAGGLTSFDEVVARRTILKEHFSRLKDADVFIVTLGLLETWFDHETGQYINLSPATGKIFDLYPGRFEFHILSHAENMANLEQIYSILKENGSPNLKFVVTTSPVPLLATFSDRDVIIANTYSK